MKKVLLHICCGVCAGESIRLLTREGFSVTGFFYNPNIHPHQEYLKRQEVAIRVCSKENSEIISGAYDPARWYAVCEEYGDQREGGARCMECYKLRLDETAQMCARLNFDYCTTTLTMSPHKKSNVIHELGVACAGEKFLAIDFKKKDGFKHAIQYAKEEHLYRQNYCGCVLSKREDRRKSTEKRDC